jgi:hypothetical protein
MPRVFISFDYDNIDHLKIVNNWKNQDIGAEISFLAEEGKDYKSLGDRFIRKLLAQKISSCTVVLILVGDNTHNRPWVDYEVHHAKCQRIKVIWTQIPGTKGAPPNELKKLKAIPFKINDIREAIRGSIN